MGQEFKALLHMVGREVGIAPARVPVQVQRWTGEADTWRAPAYASRRALLAAMVSRADQPPNAAFKAAHRDVVTTAELAETLRASGDGRLNHAVALARPADFPARDLPFPPYALGAWLGDGTSRAHARHGTAQAVLRSMGVLGNKHIPAQYLRASQAQRRALLAGLLDTDGYVSKTGTVQFAVTSQRLAEDTLQLILSLGYGARLTTKSVSGDTADSSTCFIVTFAAAQCRFVTDVRPVASVPVRCVQVDNADHMYLAGRTWIPTHNSTLALDLARAAAVHGGMTTVIFSLEMSRNEITMRLLSAEARVGLHAMRTGQLERRGLDPAGPADERGGRLAAVHRRLAEHVDDGDPGQVPAAEAAQ